MKTENAQSTVVRQYLAAVEREAAALPADRRQELVSDLAEHIEIALAERPGSSADILRELGDPRVIVATALQESGAGTGTGAGVAGAHGATEKAGTGKAARRRAPAWGVVWLPVFALAVAQLLPLLGVALRITGAVMLCRSRHWTWEQKWVGVATTAIAPSLLAMTVNLNVLPYELPLWARWLVVVSSVGVTCGGAGRLWKVRKH